MQFRLLGALEAGSGGTVVDLGPPKQRAVLAILLLHVGEIVSVDRLIDLLWGDDPPRTAAHSIQIYVSDLRKSLEPIAGNRLILTRPPGYQLDTPPDTVDAKQFERLVQQGSEQLNQGKRDAAVATLRTALELWRGPALSDFEYEEFAQPYVRRLNDLHLDAIETLASSELEGGRAGQAIPLLEAAIRDDPLRERSRELLMVALYRSGRHAEALRNYDNLRVQLRDELGLDPSPALQRMRDRVLLHDPALVPASDGEAEPTTTRNPYKGLQPFGENDADDFFGRDGLVERLIASVEAGQRLIALVGPSGSGKSSVVAAGLIPRLRSGAIEGSDKWPVVSVPVGADPLGDVRAAVARATGSANKSRTAPGLGLAAPEPGRRVLLVLDQFEQLFTVADEARRNEFLKGLAGELSDPDGQLTVVLTLRADFYDRPLQHPEFSAVFVPGVVHVLPMSAAELEAAVVEPAERVGVKVEPALLAELVTESVAGRGSLPLLQYALTELFEQRSGPVLTHAGYLALGGLRGVLSRRAEAVFLGLDADGQQIATQLFLRLVRLGRGSADFRRRLTLSELTDLQIDSVALSKVLTEFGRHRLLTFDHDPATDEATVEMAHEALLTEWERLAGWIDRHRAALRRRDALLSAVDEWELSDRNVDYLLTGTRLAEFETWSREGSLQLTTREREFLEAGLERSRAESAAKTAEVEARHRLQRSARRRLIALGVAVLTLGGAAAFAFVAIPRPLAPVTLMWTDEGFVGQQAEAGFDQAVTKFDLVGRKFPLTDVLDNLVAQYGRDWDDPNEGTVRFDAEQAAQVQQRVNDGVGLIVLIGNYWPPDVEQVAREHPDTRFAMSLIGNDVPNVLYFTTVDSEPSYLAGAVAAMKSKTGVIGYIGGVDWDGIWPFQAGYEAGARAANPNIQIISKYLSTIEDFSGFDDADKARSVALQIYGEGADVIFHAAGNSGLGVFDAATEFTNTTARQVWAIGVDTDQHETVLTLPGSSSRAHAWQTHILTSVLKGIDAEVYAVVAAYGQRKFEPGVWKWGLESGAMDISYSGGYLEDIRGEIDALKAKIISGEIIVPCIPQGREADAIEVGIAPGECHPRLHN
ncbi:MAG TPA: BTAD domain-containing putative transcriptional regulator [Methylomirabilota bacterium]|nr:BTAD domain-containing putative transcriptional regulator [Methylomirabilota bacterium]